MRELANYGEYSGDPSEEFTYLYAKTILDSHDKEARTQKARFLLIGGGIANFTDVAATFQGHNQSTQGVSKKPPRKQSQDFCPQRWTKL